MQLYQDAMAMVRKLGKPDLFITFTCNPRWPEIRDALLPGQQPNDRPDLIARVFRIKLQELLTDLIKRQVLGRVVGHMHVVEFQKRGLPHAHILLILAPEDKLLSPDQYDTVVTAELPDPISEPELYETISTCMMHGPCGCAHPNASCMKPKDVPIHQRSCSKGYPKPFEESSHDADGYPHYRRRQDGRFATVQGVQLDNRWVVPYNRALCKKYNVSMRGVSTSA
jgi:hypothetical protein